MEYVKARIAEALIRFFDGDYRRIDHALSVLKHAERIAERVAGCDGEILIAASLLHDVGIKPSEEKLGYNNGLTQERYGPAEAERLLKSVSFPAGKIRKVREMVGNHHSKLRYDYPELAVLRKADTIVNGMDRTIPKKRSGRRSTASGGR